MSRRAIRTLVVTLVVAVAGAVVLWPAGSPDPLSGPRFERVASPVRAPCLFAFSSRLEGDVQARRFEQLASRLSVLAPNWYALDRATGALSGDPDRSAVTDVARRHGVAVWPVLNEQVGFRPLFSSAAQRRKVARRLAARASRDRVAGWTLDIESIRPEDRSEFTAFVRELSALMHRKGRRVAVYATRRTGDRPNRSAAAYDWRALVRHADLVLASGYNEHAASTDPGPLTTTAGFRAVVRYAATVSKRRVVPLGAAFGWKWPKSGGAASLIASADALMESRGASGARVSGGAGTYETSGARVWFETGAGLRARAASARRGGMRWFGVFSLGREPAGTLNRLPNGHACARWAR